jgi:outer membrane receptor protein involved in Fe transport
MDWMVGYNSAFRNQPDYKRFRYNADGSNLSLFIPNGAAQTAVLGRTFIDLKENAQTAAVNFVKKVAIGNKDSGKEFEFKTGLFYEDKSRDFGARNIGYVKSIPTFRTTLPIDQLFVPQNFNSVTGIKIDEQTNPNDSYEASNNLFAAYLSANFAVSKKFNIIAGLRGEQNAQKLNSFDQLGNVIKYDNSRLDLLPSLNFTYNFTEKSLLRLAYGKTLNRPEFRELAPFSFYDFVNNRTISGNSKLKNANIQNFDLRFENYPTPSELFSIAAFYKSFTNPIEVIFDSGANPILNFTNAQSAYSTGLEAEMRKNLSASLPNTFLGKTSLVFNASYIFSRVKLDPSIAATQSDNRPLQGQSPYSATKIAADQLADSFYTSFNLPVVIARPFNTYGPRQSARAVIPTIISQIANGQRSIKLGAVSPTRDFNYVQDTVDGFIAALNSDLGLGEVINFGSNFEISVGDTAQLIAEAMNVEIEIITDEVRLRPENSEVERLWADNAKAKQLLGWQPSHSGRDGFKRGLAKTAEWFSQADNLRGYKADIYNL